MPPDEPELEEYQDVPCLPPCGEGCPGEEPPGEFKKVAPRGVAGPEDGGLGPPGRREGPSPAEPPEEVDEDQRDCGSPAPEELEDDQRDWVLPAPPGGGGGGAPPWISWTEDWVDTVDGRVE